MSSFRRAFFAYPSGTQDLVQTIEKASQSTDSNKIDLKIWPLMDVFGAVIPDEIRTQIDTADFLFADITVANNNVYYEIGYAIGRGKPIAPVLNSTFASAVDNIQADGIFDIIGYRKYENSSELTSILHDGPDKVLINLYSQPINRTQPVYFLTALRKSNFVTAISAAIKDAGAFFRTFDPAEVSRFSAVQIIADVSASAGVIIPFLAPHVDDAVRHNLRAAFLAGIAHGLEKSTLLLRHQTESSASSADYRDAVKAITFEKEISPLVSELVKQATIALQAHQPSRHRPTASALQRLTIGAIAAENEFKVLQDYFVETSEFLRAQRGEVGIVAGRKGSGKTAIFFMVRDAFRKRKNAIVVDLRPDSHQLSLFRSELIKFMDIGAFDHTIAAFWRFVIFTEILLAIKKELSYRATRNPALQPQVLDISRDLEQMGAHTTGDFTTRVNYLTNQINQELSARKKRGGRLGPEEITNIIFKRGVAQAKNFIASYSGSDDEIILLFDNIDKGWTLTSLDEFDVRLLRLLLEALDSARHDLTALSRQFMSIVFLRNDVLELLVENTPDRGKASVVRIDWKDRVKLRNVIYKRLQVATSDWDSSFGQLWHKFFVPNVGSKESFEFFVDHCLMRPRFLLQIIENAIANGIDRGHDTVDHDDCIDAVKQHSSYLLGDFGYEIRDVSGVSSRILQSLVGTTQHLTRAEVIDRFKARRVAENEEDKAFDLMLWYGALGIITKRNTEMYIYDFEYIVDRMKAEIEAADDEVLYVTNPAFHVALQTA